MSLEFEQRVEQIKESHKKSRPIFAARPITGQRIAIERPEKEAVDTIVYRPQTDCAGPLPVLFNMHGGGFSGGDAVLMDSFCSLLAQSIPAVVVNVNYKKSPEYAFPYAIEEVADCVYYFADHAAQYGVDPARMAVGGHSAGGSLAAGAALKIKEEGRVALACQLLVYPCTDMDWKRRSVNLEMKDFEHIYCQNQDAAHRWASPAIAADEELAGVCPAIFVLCELDGLREQGERYANRLMHCMVPVSVSCFAGALHGFVEVNRPDYFYNDERKTPQQDALCRQAEQYIIAQLRAYFK